MRARIRTWICSSSPPPKLSWVQRAALMDAFEASPLPYRVDLVEAARLSSGYAQRIRQESVLL
ncbi:MAG: hypothetical protein LRY31_00990 [Burkholderiaceae bacterium]|nr:hypothetical protein [Burkholderiaceae bacterium]